MHCNWFKTKIFRDSNRLYMFGKMIQMASEMAEFSQLAEELPPWVIFLYLEHYSTYNHTAILQGSNLTIFCLSRKGKNCPGKTKPWERYLPGAEHIWGTKGPTENSVNREQESIFFSDFKCPVGLKCNRMKKIEILSFSGRKSWKLWGKVKYLGTFPMEK